MKTRPTEQFADNDSMNNYEISDILSTSLPEAREDSIIYPRGCKEDRNPVLKKDQVEKGIYGSEQKVGDHHEYE